VTRRRILQAAKVRTGLVQHRIQRWTLWHRRTAQAILAHALVAISTAAERDDYTNRPPGYHDDHQRIPAGLRRSPFSAPSTPTIDETRTNDHERRPQY